MSDDANGGRVLTKDVYDLVDSTRKEVTASITDLGNKFDAFVTSNEHRLTILETHQAAQAHQITEVFGRLDEHGKDIGALKDQQRQDEAATSALSGAKNAKWTKREKLIGSIASIVIATVALITILITVFH